MRGATGLIIELLPLAVIAFVFVVVFVAFKGWRRGDGKARKQRRTGLIAAAVLSLMFAPWWMRALDEIKFHHELATLEPESVSSISVGSREFRDRSSITRIVNDLKTAEWYSVNHGGWGDETTIVVRRTTDSDWYMSVGYHFGQQGAVVVRRLGGPSGLRITEDVFSPTLPATLEQLGVPLSHCDTAHGHPCSAPSPAPVP